MSKNKMKAAILASALAGCLTIGGISAYFTDADTKTNVFTVGKVAIELTEPSWEPPTDITPEQEMKKDPQVENTGINDAYIFVEVTVPYAEVVTANENGTVNPKGYTELFTYELNPGWVELSDEKVIDEEEGIVKHLYAYGTAEKMAEVKKGEVTTTVFDVIKFVNLVESDEIAGKTLNVIVNAYGIQTKNLKDEQTNLNGDNEDGITEPGEVWMVLVSQNEATVS